MLIPMYNTEMWNLWKQQYFRSANKGLAEGEYQYGTGQGKRYKSGSGRTIDQKVVALCARCRSTGQRDIQGYIKGYSRHKDRYVRLLRESRQKIC